MVEQDERLRERDLGLLDGFTSYGVEAQFPKEAQRRKRLGSFYYRPPVGESWADVAGRVRAVFERHAPRDGERSLVVTHQAVIMLARYVLEDLTETQVLEIDRGERLANTAVTTYVAASDGPLRLARFNDVSHLGRTGAPTAEEPGAARVG